MEWRKLNQPFSKKLIPGIIGVETTISGNNLEVYLSAQGKSEFILNIQKIQTNL